MPSVIEECKAICDVKKVEYQELLKVLIYFNIIYIYVYRKTYIKTKLQVRIAKFIDDLDIYELQCNELQYWGDINEISKYVTRVHRLDEKYVNLFKIYVYYASW